MRRKRPSGTTHPAMPMVHPNAAAIAVCREHGHEAYVPEEFAAVVEAAEPVRQFDTLLCAHVLEHLDEPTGVDLIGRYMQYIVSGGRVMLITPQERGQRSDETHVRMMDVAALTSLAKQCGLVI